MFWIYSQFRSHGLCIDVHSRTSATIGIYLPFRFSTGSASPVCTCIYYAEGYRQLYFSWIPANCTIFPQNLSVYQISRNAIFLIFLLVFHSSPAFILLLPLPRKNLRFSGIYQRFLSLIIVIKTYYFMIFYRSKELQSIKNMQLSHVFSIFHFLPLKFIRIHWI